MDLLGDIGHVETRFSPFRDSGSVSGRQVHGFRQAYHRHINHFGEAEVDARFGLFGDSANLNARWLHDLH
jgi:hypothetical protein